MKKPPEALDPLIDMLGFSKINMPDEKRPPAFLFGGISMHHRASFLASHNLDYQTIGDEDLVERRCMLSPICQTPDESLVFAETKYLGKEGRA